jgi:hypothetical protein
MTNLKRLAVLGAVVMAIGATTVTAFASANLGTPAELAAAVTGKTVEEVTEEKLQSGKTYGEIAKDYESLEEFQSAMLENKIAILKERVAAGTMTQEEADAIIKAIEENQSVCDGTGQARVGQQFGAGFGGMMGNGSGQGRGTGLGNGLGLRNRTCLVQE